MKTRRLPRSVISALVCAVVLAVGYLLLCPPSLLSKTWRGTGYWSAKPQVLMVVPGKDGRLAVAIRSSGTVRIYVSDGSSGLRAVTHGIYDADPAWNPSGTRIAYAKACDGPKMSLHVLNLEDGSDSTVISFPKLSQPCWTPDGNRIAFMRNRLGMRAKLQMLDLKTGEAAELARTPLAKPQCWSLLAGGKQIAYIDENAVWLKSVAGGEPRKLPVDVKMPCTVVGSPDGKFLFVIGVLDMEHKSGLVVDLAGNQVETVSPRYMRYALWSPSGKYLALTNKYDTDVFATDFSARPGKRLKELAKYKGIGMCWRSDSSLMIVRPDMADPHQLDEVDVTTGKTKRIFASSTDSGKAK